MAYECVVEPGTGKLLFKIDRNRGIIEIQRRGKVTHVDLAWYGLSPAGKETTHEQSCRADVPD
jgi:hypothetical protein